MITLIDKLKDIKYFAETIGKTHHSTDDLEFLILNENSLDSLLKTKKNVILIFELPNSFKSEIIVTSNVEKTITKKIEQAKNVEVPPFSDVFAIRSSTGNNFPTVSANYIAALLASGDDSKYSFKEYEVFIKLSKQDKKIKTYIEKELARL
jgi:hypothetical protein